MTYYPTVSQSSPLEQHLRHRTTHSRGFRSGLAARLLISLTVLLLAACTNPIVRPEATRSPDPAHNSRNSLDWLGTYSGTLPCADCAGIALRLSLSEDGQYQLSTQYLDRQDKPSINSGRFTWTYDGNHIQLDAAADHAFYAVREGSLLRRYADGTWPQGEQAGLMTLQLEP